MYQKLVEGAKSLQQDVVEFARQLVRTPSISGQEKNLADLCLEKMKELGYDEMFRDGAGNVVGIIKGTGGGANIMYNSHMDHVDPGDPSNWEYPPYEAQIADGCIHGRAASDVKCGLASQIYAGAMLKKLGIKLKGDYIFTGVVQEEPAEMFGMRYLMDRTFPEKGIRCDLMISSEATSMNLYLGHRGRLELEVQTRGRTSHGSAPWRGINAVYKMMPVIEYARSLGDSLPEHPFLGKSTLALTIISCSPGALSIIPDICTVSLDRRFIPGETAEKAIRPFEELFNRLSAEDPEFKASIKVRKVRETSYTGYSEDAEKNMMAWVVEKDNPFVIKTIEALKSVGQNPGFGKWDFGTDASYVTGVKGIPTIGYSPMEEKYAHTPSDRCRIDYLVESLAGNAAIALNIAG